MRGKAFTFIEMLLVLIVVGMLTVLSLDGFRYARDSHRVDSLIQELTLLRTAIMSYREMHGKLPEIEESELSSDNFNALKHFWYPFRPENSKIIEGGVWWGKITADAETSFLAVKKGCDYVSFDMDILQKKMQKLCCVEDRGLVCAGGTYFYFLAPY